MSKNLEKSERCCHHVGEVYASGLKDWWNYETVDLQ